MDTLTVNVLVHKISYIFRLDGSIIPYINIFPSIVLPNGRIIQKFPFPKVTGKSDVDIAPKDKLEITLFDDLSQTIQFKIVERSESPRRSLVMPKCPICDAPLFESETGIGRCINRSCMGQISQTILLFASALGLVFQHPIKKIFEFLLARGALTSPASIFYLTDNDLCFPNTTILESQIFQQYVHSVRGSATVDQLLRGLRIPGWDEKTIEQICTLFMKNKWGILRLIEFLEEDTMKKHKEIDWEPWKQFISLETNKRIIVELCQILHI